MSKVFVGAGIAGDGTVGDPLKLAPADGAMAFAKLKDVPAFLSTVAVGDGATTTEGPAGGHGRVVIQY